MGPFDRFLNPCDSPRDIPRALNGPKAVRAMRDEWGRVETQSWPGDKPVWTYGVLIVSLTVACAGLWLRCQTFTPLQQYWLMTYLSANIMHGFNVSPSNYCLMLVSHRD